jgi:type I restriction enzyme M protein
MIKEDYAKKVADQLWRICYVNKIGDSFNILEHLSFLLFFNSLDRRDQFSETHRNPWKDMVNQVNIGNYKIVLSIYMECLSEVNELKSINPELFKDLNRLQFPFSEKSFIELIKYLENEFRYQSDIGNRIYGQVFEQLIMKISSGVFLTPKHLSNTIIKMIRLAGDIPNNYLHICDPACGTGSLLVSSYQYLLNNYNDNNNKLTGFEINTSLSRISQMNLILHEILFSEIHNLDSFSLSEQMIGKYDVVVLNPPFSISIEPFHLHDWHQKIYLGDRRSKGNYHYINLALSLLAPGGKCAIIIPEGVLFGTSPTQIYFREQLLDQVQIDAIVSLPIGFFQNINIKTSLVLLTNSIPDKNKHKIWYYEFDQSPGRLRNSEIHWNELIEAWKQYQLNKEYFQSKNGNNWITQIEQIKTNNFKLSAADYRVQLTQKRNLKIEPNKILSQLIELEKTIEQEMNELYKLNSMKSYEINYTETNKTINKSEMIMAEDNLENVLQTLGTHLSKKQKALLDIYIRSDIPLACHEAAKLFNIASSKEIGKINVQEAKQITTLFESLGLIESVSSGEMLYPKQSENEPDRVISLKAPIKIVLWRKSERLRR